MGVSGDKVVKRGVSDSPIKNEIVKFLDSVLSIDRYILTLVRNCHIIMSLVLCKFLAELKIF